SEVAGGKLNYPEVVPATARSVYRFNLSGLRQHPVQHDLAVSSDANVPVDIPLAAPPSTDENPVDDDDSDSLLLVPVDPRASPARQALSANSVYLQSAAAAHYLPWEWETPLPTERAGLQQWIS